MNTVVDTRSEKSSRGFWVLLVILQVVALGSVQTQPLFTGALADVNGLTLAQIGVVFSVELVVAAATCCALAQGIDRWDRRALLRWGLCAVLVGTLANVQVAGWAGIVASRAVVGVGIGTVQAVLYASIAASGQAARGYAVVSAASLFWGPPAVMASAFVLQRWGMTAFLMQFVVMALAGLLMSRCLPSKPWAGAQAVRVAAASGVPLWRQPRAMALLLCIALVLLGHQALWVYQERIGRSIGLAPQAIGASLAGALIVGGLGSVAAALVGQRLGSLWPQVIGFAGSMVATLAMVYGTGSGVYVLSACAVMGAWFFGLPYLLALGAEMDPAGRLSALSASAMSFGQALAPAAAAAVVGSANFRGVGWFSTGVYAVCLGLIGWVIARQRPQGTSARRF